MGHNLFLSLCFSIIYGYIHGKKAVNQYTYSIVFAIHKCFLNLSWWRDYLESSIHLTCMSLCEKARVHGVNPRHGEHAKYTQKYLLSPPWLVSGSFLLWDRNTTEPTQMFSFLCTYAVIPHIWLVATVAQPIIWVCGLSYLFKDQWQKRGVFWKPGNILTNEIMFWSFSLFFYWWQIIFTLFIWFLKRLNDIFDAESIMSVQWH